MGKWTLLKDAQAINLHSTIDPTHRVGITSKANSSNNGCTSNTISFRALFAQQLFLPIQHCTLTFLQLQNRRQTTRKQARKRQARKRQARKRQARKRQARSKQTARKTDSRRHATRRQVKKRLKIKDKQQKVGNKTSKKKNR
jgi:hypothetical protein